MLVKDNACRAVKRIFPNQVQALSALTHGLRSELGVGKLGILTEGGYLSMTRDGKVEFLQEEVSSKPESIRYAFVEPVAVSSAQPKEESLQQTETSS